MSKRRFIKDPVWGHIEIFAWEAKLLSHFLLNRLHHIVQNSSAYRVYPGLKYSRFVHSVGVLHVATQMFTNIVRNSEDEYLEELHGEARMVQGNFDKLADRERYVSLITRSLCCPPELALLLGTVRTSALLHDLGHLPYSHIFEFSLGQFLRPPEYKDSLTLLENPPSKHQQRKLKKLHAALRGTFLPAGKLSHEAAHEVLGQQFMGLLDEDRVQHEGTRSFKPFVKGAIQLWRNKDLPISKSLLSADVDADRIDYVRRDGLFSGLYTSSIDFDRLFSFYELAETKDDKGNPVLMDGKKVIRVRPSKRASAEAEKLLWERFLGYKYIAGHHKVHLFDEILERLILFSIGHGLITDLLQALATISDIRFASGTDLSLPDQGKLVLAKEQILALCNDSWFDVHLRNIRERAESMEDDAIVDMIDGLSEQRNKFISLFKRDEDYHHKFEELYHSEFYDPIVVARYVLERKYAWERDLRGELETTIIIGDLANKLKIGLKNKDAAEFFDLTSLMEFLQAKHKESLPFNVWYYTTENDQKDTAIEGAIASFLQNDMTQLLEELKQIFEERQRKEVESKSEAPQPKEGNHENEHR